MEGVSNILLLGFPITITNKEEETISNEYFSLPIPREREIKTLVSSFKIKTTRFQEVRLT
jgi:hypothetical protein